MSYDLIELTLNQLGEQLPERLSPCLNLIKPTVAQTRSEVGFPASREHITGCERWMAYATYRGL